MARQTRREADHAGRRTLRTLADAALDLRRGLRLSGRQCQKGEHRRRNGDQRLPAPPVHLPGGHLMWKMQAGMGDAVIAPLYLLLKARKVKFEFFHSVEAIRLDAAGARVEQIDMVAQLGPNVDVSGYEPLIEVADATAPGAPGLEGWPGEPLWAKLPGSDQAATSGHDYEHAPNPDGVAPNTLQCGADKDFEAVVPALPPSPLPPIFADVSPKVPPFEDLLKHC